MTTVTASYFLLTADYGPQPNALDPVSLFLFSQANFFHDFVHTQHGFSILFLNS